MHDTSEMNRIRIISDFMILKKGQGAREIVHDSKNHFLMGGYLSPASDPMMKEFAENLFRSGRGKAPTFKEKYGDYHPNELGKYPTVHDILVHRYNSAIDEGKLEEVARISN